MNRTEHRQARKQDAYARLVLYLANRRREWSRLVFMTHVLNCFVFAPTSGLSPGWMPASPLFHSNVQRSFECPRQPACNSALGGPHGRVGAALLPVPVRPRAEDARPRHLRRRAQGHSYSRTSKHSIEQWLASHNKSPKTGAVLANNALTPNHAVHALRNSIEEWLRSRRYAVTR